MKARIYCYGHGWAFESDNQARYVGAFPEAVEVFEATRRGHEIQVWLDVYKARMGQIQTLGRA